MKAWEILCSHQDVQSPERRWAVGGSHRQAEAKLRVSMKRSKWTIGNITKITCFSDQCGHLGLLVESVPSGLWVAMELR